MDILTLILSFMPYAVILVVLICGAIAFFKSRKGAKAWLLYAVTEAEKALGGGTGRLKIRACFEQFVKLFPMLSKFISFETFSSWVDVALDEMKEMLKSNPKVKEYVSEEKVNSEKGDE